MERRSAFQGPSLNGVPCPPVCLSTIGEEVGPVACDGSSVHKVLHQRQAPRCGAQTVALGRCPARHKRIVIDYVRNVK